MKWLRSLFTLQHDYADPYEKLRARGIVGISWGVIVLFVTYFLIQMGPQIGKPGWVSQIVLGLTICLLMISLFFTSSWMARHNQLNAASVVLSLILFITALIGYVTSPALANFIPFSVPIITAGVTLNRRGMLVMLALTIAAVLGSTALSNAGLLSPFAPQAVSPANNILFTVFSLVICGVILLFFTGGQRILQRQSMTLTRELRSSTEISQTIANIQSSSELLTQAALLIRDQLGYYHTRIFMVDDKSQLLILQASTISGQQRRINRDEDTVINEVVKTGNSLRITNNDDAPRRQEMLPNMQLQILVPIKRDQKVLGVLDVQSASVDSIITNTDIEVLEAIASQIGLAVQNTQLTEQLQHSTKERQQMSEELRASLTRIEELNQEATNRAWSRYLEGRGDSVIGFDWRQGAIMNNTYMSSALEQAMSNSMPELIHDGDDQVLTVPIVSRGQRLGAMEFRAPNDKKWNNRSIELAHVIAQRLALALDNIRLFEQAQMIAHREQTASQVSAVLQSKTDLDALVATAADAFQQALGATRTSIRLGMPESTSGQNGSHSS